LNWIDTWSGKLDESLTLEQKKAFLEEMTRNHLDNMLTGGLARFEDRYKPGTDETSGPKILPYQETDKGFRFELGSLAWILNYKQDAVYNVRLKPTADAISTFNQHYLKRVLSNIKEDLNRMDRESAEIADQIKKLINHNEGLHVRVLVVNKGGSPVSLTPWGTLRLFATGNQPDATIPLRGSLDSYPSIKPGESQQLSLDSVETAEQLEIKYPLIENILKSETVMSRLALKRADISGDGGWILSATRTLTGNEDAEPEARRVGAALTR